jgi:hypothetical protein
MGRSDREGRKMGFFDVKVKIIGMEKQFVTFSLQMNFAWRDSHKSHGISLPISPTNE